MPSPIPPGSPLGATERTALSYLSRYLFQELRFLKGVGPCLGKRFAQLGIVSPWGMVCYLPHEYETFFQGPLAQGVGRKMQVEITPCSSVHKSYKTRGGASRIRCVTPDNEFLDLVFFNNSPSMKRLLPQTHWLIRGELGLHGTTYQMIHPEEMHPIVTPPPPPPPSSSSPCPRATPSPSHVGDGEGVALGQGVRMPMLVPKYAMKCGLSQNTFRRIRDQAWEGFKNLPCEEWLSPEICETYRWPSWKEALRCAHYPQSLHEVHANALWRTRLAFDELVGQQLAFLKEKAFFQTLRAPVLSGPSEECFFDVLPFSLTSHQRTVWARVFQEMGRETPMRRLIHGDVGSGKTALAFLALRHAAACGVQGVLLAPTEILARQHYAVFSQWLDGTDVRVALLLGKRKKDLQAIASGEAQIVIGTHALFQENVTFAHLGLAVIDEQQRFGVAQRRSLMEKGLAPHLLLLSATPIPRTFELALWGNVDVSLLPERPFPHNVTTLLVSLDRLQDLEEFLHKKLAVGERVYWICPLIEEDEEGTLGSLHQRVTYLEQRFPGKVGFLHGRMKTDEKESVMQAFRNGEIHILVSTTVIEVGVHVPEATVMVIEHSERFGLSQMHQIRGRVGRDGRAGYCFLLYAKPLSFVARERLRILRKSDDGFEIAEKDWQLRGGGDVVGFVQSGFFAFRFADLQRDNHWLVQARNEAARIWGYHPPHAHFLMHLFGWDENGLIQAG